jgi:hypothetical protein
LPLSLGDLSTCSSGEGSLPWLAVPTFTTAVPVENAFINAAHNNLHLEIPWGAASYPQRGGRHNKILLIYDSTFWRISGNSWQVRTLAWWTQECESSARIAQEVFPIR